MVLWERSKTEVDRVVCWVLGRHWQLPDEMRDICCGFLSPKSQELKSPGSKATHLWFLFLVLVMLHADKECYQKQSNSRESELQLTRQGEVNIETLGILSSLSTRPVDLDVGHRLEQHNWIAYQVTREPPKLTALFTSIL